jgi:hypothetical protein
VRVLLAAILCSSYALAQVSVAITATLPNEVALSAMQWRAANGFPNSAEVSGTVSALSALIPTLDATLIPPNGMAFPLDVLIESEAVRICGKTGNTLDVCPSGPGRGAYGTAPAIHAGATPVHVMKFQTPVAMLKQFLLERFQADILAAFPTPAMQTQQGNIQAAQAAINTEKQGAVQ